MNRPHSYWQGRRHTMETRAKISQALRGNRHHLGHEHTPETKAKISATMKAYRQQQERKAS